MPFLAHYKTLLFYNHHYVQMTFFSILPFVFCEKFRVSVVALQKNT